MTIQQCREAIRIRDEITAYSRLRAALDVWGIEISYQERNKAPNPDKDGYITVLPLKEKLIINKNTNPRIHELMHKMLSILIDEEWDCLKAFGVTDDDKNNPI
jgi:hypothetical protein